MNKCIVCDAEIKYSWAKYCKRCGKIMGRADMRGKTDTTARVKALQGSWDKESKCFRCYYSGIRLIDDNYKHPRYLTFDHLTPRNEGEIVVTASLINDMKSDMSVDEFNALIIQMARHIKDRTPVDENLFELKHYKR